MPECPEEGCSLRKKQIGISIFRVVHKFPHIWRVHDLAPFVIDGEPKRVKLRTSMLNRKRYDAKITDLNGVTVIDRA